MTMIIKLSKGYETEVDEEEFKKLPVQTWRVQVDKKCGKAYAYGTNGALHRQLMGLTAGDGFHVDHIKPNSTLDNRMNNLRIATASQNNANRGRNKNNKSGFKGVTWIPTRRQWQAQIFVNRKCLFLGRFRDPQEAHAKYEEAAIKHFGEFARSV